MDGWPWSVTVCLGVLPDPGVVALTGPGVATRGADSRGDAGGGFALPCPARTSRTLDR